MISTDTSFNENSCAFLCSRVNKVCWSASWRNREPTKLESKRPERNSKSTKCVAPNRAHLSSAAPGEALVNNSRPAPFTSTSERARGKLDQSSRGYLYNLLCLKYEQAKSRVCVRRARIDWGQSQFFHGSKTQSCLKYKCVWVWACVRARWECVNMRIK